jgi:hypothetical protein
MKVRRSLGLNRIGTWRGLDWVCCYAGLCSRDLLGLKATPSAAVPRPRLNTWPGGAQIHGAHCAPSLTSDAPIGLGSQSFLSKILASFWQK